MHIPVLLKEVIENLDFQDGDVYLDATLGNGGHMEAIYKRFGLKINFFGIDADSISLNISKERFSSINFDPKLAVLNFKNIDQIKDIFRIEKVDKILFDLGWNTTQFEQGGRGFSFQKDEPLLMTFNSENSKEDTTAFDVVNYWEEENLADIIYGFGEERYARRIAKKIVEERINNPIKTSKELVSIIEKAVPKSYLFGKIHPATRTFQAIRIAVNNELGNLELGLEKSFNLLNSNGRLAVISFHSLEDRIVKNFFRLKQANNEGIIITKKPIISNDLEIKENPKSRSAKLRIIQKV